MTGKETTRISYFIQVSSLPVFGKRIHKDEVCEQDSMSACGYFIPSSVPPNHQKRLPGNADKANQAKEPFSQLAPEPGFSLVHRLIGQVGLFVFGRHAGLFVLPTCGFSFLGQIVKWRKLVAPKRQFVSPPLRNTGAIITVRPKGAPPRSPVCPNAIGTLDYVLGMQIFL